MLPILVMEEFDRALTQMVPIVDLVAKESMGAMGEAEAYLQSMVELAQSLHLSIGTELAMIRARMMTYSPRDEREDAATRSGDRKRRNRYILVCLEEAKACVEQHFLKDRTLLEESEILCRKLAAVGQSKGVLNTLMNQDQLMELFQKEEEFMPALTSAIGTVGYVNTGILLERSVRLVKCI